VLRFVIQTALGVPMQLLTLLNLLVSLTSAAGQPGVVPSDHHFCSIHPPIEFTIDRTRTIVHDATLIVHARALGYTDAPVDSPRPNWTYVAFEVREVLSGNPPADTLVFFGRLVEHDSFPEDEVPYFTQHRGGGDCIASTYRAGGEYLLLLRESRISSLDPYWAFLAPTNEQVRGSDDPWIQWVRDALVASDARE
jgi:hypothetical protein